MPKRVVRLRDTINLPSLDRSKEKVQFLEDNFMNRKSSLVIRIAATHAGIITRNNGFYLPDKMAAGVTSMTKPFGKPILLHHSSNQDAIGRIVSATYKDTSGGIVQKDSRFSDIINSAKPFVAKLDSIDTLLKDGLLTDEDYQGLGYADVVARITDPEAIDKIIDNRFLTVSIGASTDKAICSICKQDWVDEGPCEHRPGQMYDEKPAFIIAGNLIYEEVSFVNSPADPFARVIEIQTGADEIQRFTLETEGDNELADESVELYLVSDDQNCAANLLSVQDEATVKTKVKDLLADGDDLTQKEDLKDSMEKEKETKQDDVKEEKTEEKVEDIETTEETSTSVVDEGTATPEEKVEDKKEGIEEKVEDEDQEKEVKEEEDTIEVETEIKNDKEEITEEELDEECQQLNDSLERFEHLTLNDIKDKEEFKNQIKAVYDFITDEQFEMFYEMAVTETKKEEFKEEDFSEALVRILERVEMKTFNADEIYEEIEKEVGDAKLSTKSRNKLPNSAFCGPNRSFPVPDCAHVTAARRLIGRAKVSAATKAKILACVARKAKALGCSSSKKEEVEVISEFKLSLDVFKALKDDELKDAFEWVSSEVKERNIESEEKENVTEFKLELDKLREEKEKLSDQLKALRFELKDVYADCSDLEDSKAELLEELHKERARRVCDFKVLTGEIKDKGGLDMAMEKELEKTPEILVETLKDASEFDLYKVADKLDDGMSNTPEGIVENPAVDEIKDEIEVENYDKIRKYYKKLLTNKGQKDADSYLDSCKKAKLVPRNFKI